MRFPSPVTLLMLATPTYAAQLEGLAQEAYVKASNTGWVNFFGSGVAISNETVVVGAAFEDSDSTGVNGDQTQGGAQSSGAAYVFERIGPDWAQTSYLKASNTGAGDLFGGVVAISGDTIVVGARHEESGATGVDGDQADDSLSDAGAAYVFVRDPSFGAWSQQAYLKASNTDAFDRFGSAVAVAGDLVVVGAPAEDSEFPGVNGNGLDDSALSAGAAYVFARTGTSWSQEAYLKASTVNPSDTFGSAVTVDGDTVAVGAPGAANSGAVYVFVRSSTTWTQQATLQGSNGEPADAFGWALALSGDTLAVSARGEDSQATGVNGDQSDNSLTAAGAAYVFVRSGTTWSQQAYLKASNTDAVDRFGASISISGNVVVIGASEEDSGSPGVNGNQQNNGTQDAGAAYAFVRSGTTWSQQAYIKASNPGDRAGNSTKGDEFGLTVGVSGSTIVVGAQSESSGTTGVNKGSQFDDSVLAAGAAYIYGTPDPVLVYCTAKTSSQGCAPPLLSSGTPSLASPAAFTIQAPLVLGGVNGLFFYGLAGPQAAPFLGGTLCVLPPLRRTPVQNSGGSIPPCDGTLTFDFNAWLQGGNDPLVGVGSQVNGQFWYRDPADPFGLGLTQAIEFPVGP